MIGNKNRKFYYNKYLGLTNIPLKIHQDNATRNKAEDEVQGVKKPPQVPSLGNKIFQAQRGANPVGDPSAGVSGISTIGGVTGEKGVIADYTSQPRADYEAYRKNSSVLNTSKQFQINTPSALGYTSVLGTSTQQIDPESLKDPEVLLHHLVFEQDRIMLDQYRHEQYETHLQHPLDFYTDNFIHLPYRVRFDDYDGDNSDPADDLPWDLEELVDKD